MKKLSVIIAVPWIGCVASLAFADGGTKHQFDAKAFSKIAKKTIGSIISRKVDPDQMLANLEKLTDMGVAGCQEHMGESETPATEKKLIRVGEIKGFEEYHRGREERQERQA